MTPLIPTLVLAFAWFCGGHIFGELAGVSESTCLTIGLLCALPVLIRSGLERKWRAERWLSDDQLAQREEVA